MKKFIAGLSVCIVMMGISGCSNDLEKDVHITNASCVRGDDGIVTVSFTPTKHYDAISAVVKVGQATKDVMLESPGDKVIKSYLPTDNTPNQSCSVSFYGEEWHGTVQ